MSVMSVWKKLRYTTGERGRQLAESNPKLCWALFGLRKNEFMTSVLDTLWSVVLLRKKNIWLLDLGCVYAPLKGPAMVF